MAMFRRALQEGGGGSELVCPVGGNGGAEWGSRTGLFLVAAAVLAVVFAVAVIVAVIVVVVVVRAFHHGRVADGPHG